MSSAFSSGMSIPPRCRLSRHPTKTASRPPTLFDRGDPGVGDNELVHSLRMMYRIAQRHQPTIAMSNNGGPFNAEMIHQTAEVTQHMRRRVASYGHVAVAVSTKVIHGQSKVLDQSRKDAQLPLPKIAGDAMDQHQVRSFAGLDVMNVEPIDEGLRHLSYLLSELFHVPEVSKALEDLSFAVLIFLMRRPLGEGLRHVCRFTYRESGAGAAGRLKDLLSDVPFQIPRNRQTQGIQECGCHIGDREARQRGARGGFPGL